MRALVCLVLLLHGPTALADTRVVHVEYAVASDARATALERSLRELLARQDANVELARVPGIRAEAIVEPPPNAPPAAAHVWIDGSEADSVVVFVVDSAWERVLVRRTPRASEEDEVAFESAAQIVAAAIEALLSGETIGAARSEVAREFGVPTPPTPPAATTPPATTPPPAPVTPSTRPTAPGTSTRLLFTAGYEASLYSRQTDFVHGPAVGASLFVPARSFEWGGSLEVQYWTGREVVADPVALRIDRGEFRALGHAALVLSPTIAVGVGLGPSLTLTRDVPRNTGPGVTSLGGSTFGLDLSIRGEASLAFRMRGDFGVTLVTGIEVGVRRPVFHVDRDGTDTELLRARSVQPFVGLRLTAPGGSWS